MKKIISICFLQVFILCVCGKVSPYKIEIKMLSPIESDSWKYTNDSLDINFNFPKGYGYQTYLLSGNIQFQLNNKTKERLYIEWENSRLMGQKPAFGTDCKLGVRLNTKKEDELVVAESSSILRELLVERLSGLSGVLGKTSFGAPWGGEMELRKNREQIFDFILPIRFESGKTLDLKFKFSIKWINIADINLVTVGMESKLVKKAIGSPESKEKKDDNIEIWHYNNNADLYILNDKVSEIKKL